MKKIITLSLLGLLLSFCKKEKEIEKTPVTGTTADYLSSANFDRLLVEIVFVKGMRPTSNTLNNLLSFLQKYLNKPAGIELTEKEITSGGKTVYSLDDIKNIELANRSVFTSGKTLAAYVFYAGGNYDQNVQNKKVLGIAYGFSSIAVFEQTIRDHSGGLTQPSETTVETTVTNHEFGHILGLVNNGTKIVTDHQDEPHGKHCDNDKCLMYYAVETSDMIANLIGNQVPVLDESCVNDLKNSGGK